MTTKRRKTTNHSGLEALSSMGLWVILAAGCAGGEFEDEYEFDNEELLGEYAGEDADRVPDQIED